MNSLRVRSNLGDYDVLFEKDMSFLKEIGRASCRERVSERV
jgi:hypothetical protein